MQLICIFRSLGLAIPPRIRFLQRLEQKQQLTNQHTEENKQIISHNKINCNINEQINIEYYNHNDKEKEQKNISQTINLNDFTLGIKMIIDIYRIIFFLHTYTYICNFFFIDDSDDDDILTVKRKNINFDDIPVTINDKEEEASNKKKAVTKAAVAKKILRKKILPNKKIIFNEEGKV